MRLCVRVFVFVCVLHASVSYVVLFVGLLNSVLHV